LAGAEGKIDGVRMLDDATEQQKWDKEGCEGCERGVLISWV
jgi:hypothetical protein